MKLPADDSTFNWYGKHLNSYVRMMSEVLPADQWQECSLTSRQLQEEGVATGIAERFAVLEHLDGFLPLASLVSDAGNDLESLIRLHAFVSEKFQVAALMESIDAVPVRDSWDRRARESILSATRKLILQMVKMVAAQNLEQPEQFFRNRRQEFRNFAALRDDLLTEEPGNFHPYTVLLSALEGVLHNSGK
jgi:glutamate dehydrogenase